jgi:hypothetical protein
MDANKLQVIDEIEAENEQPTTSKGTKAGIIIGAMLLLAIFIGAIIFLALDAERTELIRDIFVILLGLELFLIGAAMVLLVLQATKLANMFQHEIKPVLDAANETMSTLRGTAIFLSDSFVEPVMKLSGTFASIRQAFEILKNLTK